MPPFRITVVNESVTASDEHNLPAAEEAQREAIKAALEIGTEEIIKGKPFFGAEVKVERDSQVVERFVVSIGVSPLQ